MFISRASQPPPIPIVGVIPIPKVVASKFALVLKFAISDQLLSASGTQIPALILVAVLAFPKIP
ncbi:hypothetical protein D3C80_1077290 [compost metagenome]